MHIMLLCPTTMQVASAVGHYLSCTIAKLGMFKALKKAVVPIGPMHYLQCINMYKGKWLKSYKQHAISSVYSDVIQLFTQPRLNTLCVRSPELMNWASECVMNINHVYTLSVMLPPDWRHTLTQSNLIHNQARMQQIAQPKAKAKAKAKAANRIIGIVSQPRTVVQLNVM